MAALSTTEPSGAGSPPALQETRSTCPYCGVGCGVLIRHDADHIVEVRGDPEHPANLGRLCSKGSTLHLTQGSTGRVLRPELRRTRTQPRVAVSWNEALDHAAGRFADVIREHGPDAVAFYISGQLLTEDYYIFNKLAKGLIGTNNVDTNSRLCMSSAVAAYKQTLGADAPPCCYEDFDHTDCLLIVGANPAFAHPVSYRRIEAAREQRPQMKVIVVDPRRTDTAAAADLHLAVLPGTDIWLFNAMLHVLLWDGYIDQVYVREHTTGFDALKQHVRDITPRAAAAVCGVDAEDIVQAAHWWGESPAAMSLWCQGLNQSAHGTHNGAALIALSLATGKIGRPGCGPFSLTGQPNAMGGREVGGMANLLSGHRDLGNPVHRAEVAALWGIDSVPEHPGLTAVELFEAVAAGQIKALWIACTNPAHSLPNQPVVRAALEACPFVVLQDAYAGTETAPYADLLLPASTWGEKEGTVTNSERCISRVLPAVPPPGEARHDWRIAMQFAHLLGARLGQTERAAQLFPYRDSAEVFAEHARSTAGRDLDISGLDHATLEALGPQQWPFPAGARAGQARLYADGRFPTEDGRARFVVPVSTLGVEPSDARFPFQLNSGRLRDQWHGMSRSGRVPRLHQHVDEPRVELHPEELARRGFRNGDLLRIRSRRGQIVLRAYAEAGLRMGQAYIAMHWGRQRLSHAGVNELTLPVCDPFSRQPELKGGAVAITRAELPFEVLMLRTAATPQEAMRSAVALQETLAPRLDRFGYASVFLAGRELPVVVLRIAQDRLLDDSELTELDALFGLDDPSCLSMVDARRNIRKRALIEDDRLLAMRLCGDLVARDWLQELMCSGEPVGAVRRWLLAPVATPPGAAVSQGRIVCSCVGVPELAIREVLATGASLAATQERLGCGTRCGSCLPELRRMATTVQKR